MVEAPVRPRPPFTAQPAAVDRAPRGPIAALRDAWADAGDWVVIAAVLIGACVAIWPVVVAFAAPGPVQLLVVVAHVCGMLGGYGAAVLIALMSRWPVLERAIGSDQLVRWHARGGRIVLSLILVHAVAAVLAWSQARGLTTWAAVLQVMAMPYLVAASVGTALLVAIAVVSVRIARRQLRHEVWHGVHLLAYVAAALAFLHQLAGPDLVGHRVLQIAWALAYAHVFGLVLRYRILAPVRAATRHRLRVEAVVEEAPGVVSIILAGQHLDELESTSGQFFRWRFLTPDTWLTAHPFSLSAPAAKTRLRLTVKALGDGSRLLQRIEVGTWVVAEGPYGAMTARRRTRRDVLLVAGGVGITPMRTLFETMPIAPGGDLLLLYRARTPDELVFRGELDAIAARRGARVRYLLGDDRRILSSGSLRGLVPNIADRDVYLCGPPGMAGAVRASLLAAGVAAAHLHEERFAF